MMLVVGGLNGFVGSNTTEALVKQGIDCVVTRHKDTDVPKFLEKYLDRHVFIENADATSVNDLQKIGEKHKIEGIVNVAGGFTSASRTPVPGLKGYFDMLLATFQVADEWKVRRVTFSSTGGLYLGHQGLVKEEVPISLSSPVPIVSHQKIVEVASSEFERKTGISSVCVRLMGMFGPGQDHSQGSLIQRLVHSAVSGKPPSLERVWFGHAEDGVDFLYIKDVAKAIVMLQTAEKLPNSVYNVGSGKLTMNREMLEAVEKAVPSFKLELPAGRTPGMPPMPVIDTERLRSDTGFSPSFDNQSAIREYVEWMKEGNAR